MPEEEKENRRPLVPRSLVLTEREVVRRQLLHQGIDEEESFPTLVPIYSQSL